MKTAQTKLAWLSFIINKGVKKLAPDIYAMVKTVALIIQSRRVFANLNALRVEIIEARIIGEFDIPEKIADCKLRACLRMGIAPGFRACDIAVISEFFAVNINGKAPILI